MRAHDVARIRAKAADPPSRKPTSQSEPFRRRSAGGWSFADIALSAPGERVPGGMRSNFVQRTGASLGSVRLHTSPTSHLLAAVVQEKAFTVGQDIHFADGEFQPGTRGRP